MASIGRSGWSWRLERGWGTIIKMLSFSVTTTLFIHQSSKYTSALYLSLTYPITFL